MPTRRNGRDLQDAIQEALARHPEGLNREALQAETGRSTEAPHTFRLVLKALEKQGKLRREGKTRGSRYLPVAPSSPAATPPSWEYSPEGAQVLEGVSRPLGERTPCSYDRAFLDAYLPNQTFYLRPEDRALLREIGQTPAEHQPAGTYARQILERLLIDLSWNSSRLEGNTYSLLDTERLIREGHAPEGKDAQETQMILNHKQAIEFLVEGAGELSLSALTLRTLHGMLSENLLANPADEGRLRRGPVQIGQSVYLPLAVPQLIEEIFEQLLATARAIEDPFEQAFFLLVHLPYLQPFEDVNKRTSRLAANLPLLQRNLQPLSFNDLPIEAYRLAILGVYEQRRMEALRDLFLWAYRRSSDRYRALRQSIGEPDPFRLRYRNALRDCVRQVVQGKVPAREIPSRLEAFAAATVPESDRLRFQAVALQELRNLNEGTYARVGLRPSEFEGWREIQAGLDGTT